MSTDGVIDGKVPKPLPGAFAENQIWLGRSWVGKHGIIAGRV